MGRGYSEASRAALGKARLMAAVVRIADRLRGLEYARAWRVKNKPRFDALYGVERG